MVARVAGWEMRLADYLRSRRGKPFEWGVNDCLTFVAKAIEALTEVDVYAPYAGYTTEEEAYVILDAAGGMRKVLDDTLGKSHNNPLKSRRGDVVIFKDQGLTCGIVDDSGQFIAAVSKEGLVRVPLKQAIRIWSV